MFCIVVRTTNSRGLLIATCLVMMTGDFFKFKRTIFFCLVVVREDDRPQRQQTIILSCQRCRVCQHFRMTNFTLQMFDAWLDVKRINAHLTFG